MIPPREQWASRLGLVLAAVGSAVGIGNLLRFPSKAAANGGGAFMVAYLVSLVLLGIPLMWVAWTVGRYGGRFRHGTLPGQFDRLWRHPAAKYLGVLGLTLPLGFCFYYTYIGAWCLGYGVLSLTGDFQSTAERAVDLAVYLDEFRGDAPTQSYFGGVSSAALFMLITVLAILWVLHRGVVKGIERMAKVTMPLLFVFCTALAVRVFTLDPVRGTAWQGLERVWNPEFRALADPNVWIAAAGHVFWTLALGCGAMECYASYVRPEEDIALAGLTATAANGFVEVVFGTLIAIPAAAIFFGAAQISSVATSGTFSIGMISMPEILRNTPGLGVFGTLWFLLLFLAAFASSVGVAQPVMAFLQDELKMSRQAAAALLGLVWLLGAIPVVWFYKYGVFEEMELWIGTIGLFVCAILEVTLFAWVFGARRGWEELHRGAQMTVPRIFSFILRYVTPAILFAIFGAWLYGAVAENSLAARPRVRWGVVDRHRLAEEFVKAIPSEKEFTQLEDGVRSAVDAARRYLHAWAEVEVGGPRGTRTVSCAGDPALKDALSVANVQRWLELQGWAYQGAATRVTLAFEALYTAPYIWLTRAIVAAMHAAFIVLIAVAWRHRNTT